MLGRHHPNGQFFYVSPASERLLGFSPEELIGTDPYALVHPEDVAPIAEAHRAVSCSEEPHRIAVRMRHRGGAYRWCHTTARAVRDPQTGAVLEIHTSTRDAADWRETEAIRKREALARAALAENEALLRVAKAVAREDAPEEVFALVSAEAGRLLGADSALVAQFGSEGAIVRGAWGADSPPVGLRFSLRGELPIATVFRTGATARADSYDRLRQDGPTSQDVVPASSGSGVAVPVFLGGHLWGAFHSARAGGHPPAPEGEEDRLTHFAELISLTLANAAVRNELALRATTDSLTGLANHRAFYERLEYERARARRYGHHLSVAIIDIDNFKLVNDSKGHQVGDGVLVEVARRLSAVRRTEDVIGRMGGEEFAWLLPETGIESAVAASRRACRAIRDVPFGPAGIVTCSIGVCAVQDGDDAGSLYRRADEALYAAKNEGRDRVVAAAPGPDAGERPAAVGVS